MSTQADFTLIRQTLAAPAEAVFDAWVTPATMKRWMFVTDDNEIYKAQADLREGGAYSILEWTGSEHIDHFGHYLKIDRPTLLAFTLQAPKHFKARTSVTIAMQPHGEMTRVTFHQIGIGPSVVQKPWLMMFDSLAKWLGDRRPVEQRDPEIKGSG